MKIWEDIISDHDRFAFERIGNREKIPFGKKPAFLIIDMTYNFVDSQFPLGNSEMGYKAVKAIKELLGPIRGKGIPVIYTKGQPQRTGPEMGRWKRASHGKNRENLDPKGFEIVEDIFPQEEDIVITKQRPSAFFGTNLVSYLLYLGVDCLIIGGMTTSGCVRATVVDAFSYNYPVIIPLECVGDRSLISHKVSLFDMHMKYAEVMDLQEVIELL